MLLQEIFDQLSQGEVGQLSLGGSDESGILRHEWFKLLPHINLGIQTIYERFNLNRQVVTLRLTESIKSYYLDEMYALSNTASTEPVKYLIDSLDSPFKGNILKLDQVRNSNGNRCVVNNIADPESIVHSQFNSLYFPNPIEGEEFQVHYRTKPDNIVLGGLDPNSYEVDLPLPYLSPLIYFVASRMLSSNDEQASVSYINKFEMACNHITRYGLTIDDSLEHSRFEDNGFV